MRQLADRYRDLFPAILTAVEVRGAVPFYGWLELSPTAEGPYAVQPGARSGTPQQNWLRELSDRLVLVPCLVWVRHRDEDSQLHFEGVVPTDGRTLVIAPPPGTGSGSGSDGPVSTVSCPGGVNRRLCVAVTAHGACACLAGRHELVYRDELGYWLSGGSACGVPVLFSLKEEDDGLTFGIDPADGDETPGPRVVLDSCDFPQHLGTVAIDRPAFCAGAVSVTIEGGPCDDCDFSIVGPGKLCLKDVTIDFGGTPPPVTRLLQTACPVFFEIREGDGIAITQLSPTVYVISATGGTGGGGMAIGGAIANGPIDGDVLAVGPGGVLAQFDSISGGAW